MNIRLVLASASPARLRTLTDAGLAPEVIVSGVDEDAVIEPDPAALALRLAQLKGLAVQRRLPEPPMDCLVVVVACDSVFEFDGQAFGKPASEAEARSRLLEMSGRSGVLHTGHFVASSQSSEPVLRGARTTVRFASMSEDEVAAYVGTGEPVLVAGGFTLDGLGGAFVESVQGDPHNVVGISLPLLRLMLAELGVRWTDLWVGVRP